MKLAHCTGIFIAIACLCLASSAFAGGHGPRGYFGPGMNHHYMQAPVHHPGAHGPAMRAHHKGGPGHHAFARPARRGPAHHPVMHKAQGPGRNPWQKRR